MSIQSEQLKERTMQFAMDVLDLVETFPRTISGDLVSRQLAKCATSVASNYRATCAARSRPEFIAKLGIVFEETDESEFWLDVLRRRRLGMESVVERLHGEAIELRAIFGRSLGTARANSKNHQINNQITK